MTANGRWDLIRRLKVNVKLVGHHKSMLSQSVFPTDLVTVSILFNFSNLPLLLGLGANFRHLRTVVINQNSIHERIKSRLKSDNAYCHSVQNLFSSVCYPKI